MEALNLDKIKYMVKQWLDGDKRKFMLTSEKYYNVENDIFNRKMVLKIDGAEQELINVANNKLAHGFYRKLVRQKVNYLVGAPFSITGDSRFVKYLNNEILTERFYTSIKNTVSEAILKGIAWQYVYYENNKLNFKLIPSEQIIPEWKDYEHNQLLSVLRVYDVKEFTGEAFETFTIVEYYTIDGIVQFQLDGDDLIPLGHELSHYIIQGDEVKQVWDKIPFIPFKYTMREEPLLRYIKSLIDDYDNRRSDSSNVIQDSPNGIKVIKNYDGEDVDELINNLINARVIKVQQDGDVSVLSNSIDSAALEAHLTRLRKDIYETGSGVDTQDETLGNASGVALKFRYGDLELDCKDIATEVRASLANMFEFIAADAGALKSLSFDNIKIDIKFSTDMVLNDTETINSLSTSYNSGLMSQETAIANHPYIENPQHELELINKERTFDPYEDSFGKEDQAKDKSDITDTEQTEQTPKNKTTPDEGNIEKAENIIVLNGAQIQSALKTVSDYAHRLISRESGIAILQTLNLSKKQAEIMIGTETFIPADFGKGEDKDTEDTEVINE